MKTKTLKKIIREIPNFNALQFRLLKEGVEKRIKKKKVANILETEEAKLICPFCYSKEFIKWGKRYDLQRYKCKSCCRTFNSLTNTPLARLRRKGHWLTYADCLTKGYTLAKAAEISGIHINTSFRWRHRFLSNFKFIKAKKLGGIVENTHLKMKESFKGSPLEKIIPKSMRKDVFVIYGLDRNNNIFDITNKGFSENVLKSQFEDILIFGSLVFSEKSKQYSSLTTSKRIRHIYSSKFSDSLYGLKKSKDYIEEFTAWIFEHFRGVATKYLENYVSWFRSLKEFQSGITSLTVLYRAKSIEKYRHQPEKVKRFI
ncbi:MAG: hypothetical protein N4A49_11100 [Marinifilaceae bacterium]|jgi:transposase-like protein|nr:hypothetical protein [Marinifilaceae bacterium]